MFNIKEIDAFMDTCFVEGFFSDGFNQYSFDATISPFGDFPRCMEHLSVELISSDKEEDSGYTAPLNPGEINKEIFEYLSAPPKVDTHKQEIRYMTSDEKHIIASFPYYIDKAGAILVFLPIRNVDGRDIDGEIFSLSFMLRNGWLVFNTHDKMFTHNETYGIIAAVNAILDANR